MAGKERLVGNSTKPKVAFFGRKISLLHPLTLALLDDSHSCSAVVENPALEVEGREGLPVCDARSGSMEKMKGKPT